MIAPRGSERTAIYAALGLRKGVSELLWGYRKSYSLEEFPAYLDDHPLPILSKVRAEMENGIRTADVIIAPHYLILKMVKMGLLGKYSSPEIKKYPEWARDGDSNWAGVGITRMFPSYNRNSIPRKKLPRSIEDLAKNYSRGGVASQALVTSSAGSLTTLYLTSLRRVLGETRWNALLDHLARDIRPPTYDCIDHLLQAVSAGKHAIAFAVYSLAYHRMRDERAPIAPLEIEELPPLWTLTSAALVRGAEEKPAAQHFLDYLLSREGQRRLGAISGIWPIRLDKNSRMKRPRLDKGRFFPLQEELEQMEDVARKLTELGLN